MTVAPPASRLAMRKPATVCLDDLAAQREAESRAAFLGRVERQQRIFERGGAEAGSAIAHFDAETLGHGTDGQLDTGRVGARFARVLEQVDERLLDLRRVEGGNSPGSGAATWNGTTARSRSTSTSQATGVRRGCGNLANCA